MLCLVKTLLPERIPVKVPTAYMVPPHGRSWRICSVVPVTASWGVPLAGSVETGPVTAAAAGWPAPAVAGAVSAIASRSPDAAAIPLPTAGSRRAPTAGRGRGCRQRPILRIVPPHGAISLPRDGIVSFRIRRAGGSPIQAPAHLQASSVCIYPGYGGELD